MKAKKYTAKQMNIDLKRAQMKKKCKENFQKVIRWCIDNKEIVILLAPAGFSLLSVVIKTISKVTVTSMRAHAEKTTKDLYCYDRSLGHYWKLKRELKSSEWVQVNRRKANGEKLGDILDSMKVLK